MIALKVCLPLCGGQKPKMFEWDQGTFTKPQLQHKGLNSHEKLFKLLVKRNNIFEMSNFHLQPVLVCKSLIP